MADSRRATELRNHFSKLRPPITIVGSARHSPPAAAGPIGDGNHALLVFYNFARGAVMADIRITVEERSRRRCASSGSKWEPIMGYSRAVRSGNLIAVTGCVGVNADGSYDKTVGEQAARSLAIIRATIEALGGRLEHVIRTRMYVTDVGQWEQVARVHGDVFKEIRPATTIVEVARLIDDAALIEIEADAIVA
jgi:enamine deaminase RidA (YjgF/YER057c/UK114 family)